MKKISMGLVFMAVMAFSAMTWGFDAYFSDDAGNKILSIWEGRYVYVAIKDTEKGACGIDQFQADLVIFDFKTGAYIDVAGAWFRELGGIGSGLYFWVEGPGSPNKVQVPVGTRLNYAAPPAGHVHVLQPAGVNLWQDGAWEYVDASMPPLGNALPATMSVSRINLANFYQGIRGRLENNDTLVLIVGDLTDVRNIDQDQLKVKDTVSKLTVTPAKVAYGCVGACENIVVRIEDMDENLNNGEIERVPFFVIINPGSWNQEPLTGKDFCSLMRYGGVNAAGAAYAQPIRWFNIYEPDRFIHYAQAPWWDVAWPGVIRAVFFAIETAPDSGVFTYNFGNLEDLQVAMGLPRDAKFPMGTTIAFYYIDPNDFDDMDLAVITVGDRPHAQVFITDANGVPVTEVKIGHGGLYIRVYDADANVNACCQDRIVVHICDPHNEDDAEYIIIDEISNNSGIFFTQSGIPLQPVWDAISGYQLVFDDWKVQAFNEDTIFVRYNSVDYVEEDLGVLGDGNPNDGRFPPRINYAAARNQYWDVSFAKVKVYDYQVFDGTTHRMRFLDGEYRPLGATVPLSGQLYLEVTDLDQNENPLLRELIFGGWNRDQDPVADEHSAPVWGLVVPVTPPPELPPAPPAAVGLQQEPPPPPEEPVPPAPTPAAEGFFARVTPGNMLGLLDRSITNFPATVKVFIFNAQRGTWERIDLRETGVATGVFRSTVCVLVTDDRHPGDGNLGSRPGDTIMAFYQDPSNHSDISIISIKVSEGGAGEVVPPVVTLSVAFDRSQYYPGDTVTITVTDEQYAGAMEIVGTNVLALLDKDGGTIASWNKLEAVAGQPGKFRVTYVLPETVKLGTITAKYTDPYVAGRTEKATATVVAKALSNVTGITVSPNPFKTSTTFTIQAEPAGALAGKITITVYDLTGSKVDVISGTNTASVTWTGKNLGNGAYIYVAVVEGAGKVWTFKGFVYIER